MKRARAGVLVQGTMDLTRLPPFSLEEFYLSFIEGLAGILSEKPRTIDWPDGFERAGSLSSANTLPSLGFGIDRRAKPPASRRFQRAGSVEKGQMVWL